jgi:hypothetical protein
VGVCEARSNLAVVIDEARRLGEPISITRRSSHLHRPGPAFRAGLVSIELGRRSGWVVERIVSGSAGCGATVPAGLSRRQAGVIMVSDQVRLVDAAIARPRPLDPAPQRCEPKREMITS